MRGLHARFDACAVTDFNRLRQVDDQLILFQLCEDTAEGFRAQAETFLDADRIDLPAEFSRQARRVNFFQLYRASLSYAAYLEAHPSPGHVQLKDFDWQALLPENAPVIQTLVDGVVHGKPFLNSLDESVDQE